MIQRLTLYLVLIIISSMSCKPSTQGTNIKGTNEQKNKGNSTQYAAIVAQKSTVKNTLKLTGTTIASESVDIKSEVTGRVVKMYFEDGALIKKGQILVKLYDEDLLVQLKKAEIEITHQENILQRQKQLLSASAISQEEFDISETNLELLHINKKILEEQLSKTRISAPFTGKIGFRAISEGAIVNTSTTIATLIKTDVIKIEFQVPEKYFNLIPLNTSISFKTAGSDNSYSAKIIAKDPQIDIIDRTGKIRAQYNNINQAIAPGGFVEIILDMGIAEDVIQVPAIAYIPELNGAKVLTLKEGKVTPISVKSLGRNEQYVDIYEGLNVGDTVITSGILQLKPGMRIQTQITPQNQ